MLPLIEAIDKVASMKTKNILGEEGALWNYADPSLEKPCEECTVIGINAGLEYPDGTNANIDTGLWQVQFICIS